MLAMYKQEMMNAILKADEKETERIIKTYNEQIMNLEDKNEQMKAWLTLQEMNEELKQEIEAHQGKLKENINQGITQDKNRKRYKNYE